MVKRVSTRSTTRMKSTIILYESTRHLKEGRQIEVVLPGTLIR
jgi:hypothetical protein